MTAIDLSPLYRSSIGFDRLASLLDSALRSDQVSSYPPYDIEALEENQYAITLAVAGFEQSELTIQVESGVLTVSGRKAGDKSERRYLHQGIAQRAFERKFSLADHVEVTNAKLSNGLLTISLVREVPEAMKPKQILISAGGGNVLEHRKSESAAASSSESGQKADESKAGKAA
ncbi:Hsp20 family protein [Gilvimarinus sp. F26214L]|uniref:Hsp20 family protein n=1 Tax=Gilvimarinus sp. DZF01 TaxID=3461371 RepID=UPI0040457A08